MSRNQDLRDFETSDLGLKMSKRSKSTERGPKQAGSKSRKLK